MAITKRQTAGYEIFSDSSGNRYRFFCDISGMALCTTKPFKEKTLEDELLVAWNTEGKPHFNHCSKCGKWISDPMYNADMLQCVDCAPWQTKPRFCSHCGKKIPESDTFCRACGSRLRYGEVRDEY